MKSSLYCNRSYQQSVFSRQREKVCLLPISQWFKRWNALSIRVLDVHQTTSKLPVLHFSPWPEFLMYIKTLPNCLSSFYRGQQCSRRTIVQHSFILFFHIIPRFRMNAQWSQHRVEWTRKTQVQAQLLTQRAPLHTEITRGLEHRRIVGEIEGTRTFCEDCQERSFKRRTPLKTSLIVLIEDKEFFSFLRKFLCKNSWLASCNWQLTKRSAVD